jgi:hypothetical protein
VIKLRAVCQLEGEFTIGGKVVAYELEPGDKFEADEANAARLLRRRQAEPLSRGRSKAADKPKGKKK